MAVATRIETVNWFRTHLDKASWKNVFPVDVRGRFITGNEDVNIVYYRDQPWFSVFKHSMDHEEGV